METPLVSVIIPTHNRAERLKRAIGSVLAQTYRNLEVIVIDDASTDGTAEVVRTLGDRRVRYLRHSQNRGGAGARNTGIRAARGEVIAFLDDDDAWEPSKTEEQLRLLRSYDAVVCTADGIGDGLTRLAGKQTLELKDLERGPFGGTGVLMARAFVLKEIMFDEALPRGQDWDLFIRIALKHKIGYLNRPLLRYDNGGHRRITNRIRELRLERMEQELRVLAKHRALFGSRWFRRHMAAGMLYGLKDRPDKAALIAYTARRFGLTTVLRVLAERATARLRSRKTAALGVSVDAR